MNVHEYFMSKFPKHIYAQARDVNDLESMPLDSECGDACKKAIDNAAAFVESIHMAYGDNDAWVDIRVRDLGNTVVSVCGVFICG